MAGVASNDIVEQRPARPRRERRHRKRQAAIAAGAAVLIAAVGAGYWVTHPKAVVPYGPGGTASVLVGHTLSRDSGLSAARDPGAETPERVTLTIDRIVPVVTENSARADVTVELCRRRPATDFVGSPVDVSLFAACTSTDPVGGATATLWFDQARVVVLVTPHQPGHVHIEGYDITYRDGVRHGTQRGGDELVVSAGWSTRG